MEYLILLLIPALIQAGVYDDKASIMIMSRIRQRTKSVTGYMAYNIAKHSPDLQKRGLVGDLKQKLQEYVSDTYTDKASKNFEPIMRVEMDNAFNQYYRHTKRDTFLTPEQEKHREQLFAQWLSKRLDAKFKNHMVSKFDVWKDDHKMIGKRSDVNRVTGLQKRYIERTPKNQAIFLIVTSFLLIPVFMNPFTVGLWGILFSLSTYVLFFNPIFTRMTFGTWW